eukprot:7241019-Prymnesium_polylepis.1
MNTRRLGVGSLMSARVGIFSSFSRTDLRSVDLCVSQYPTARMSPTDAQAIAARTLADWG